MDTRSKVKEMDRLIKLTQSKLVKKDGALMESVNLYGNMSSEEAARTGLGRMALQMQPTFIDVAGGHDETGHEGTLPEEEKEEAVAEPKPDHGETAMGTQDPMGKDEPVHNQDRSVTYQDAMVKPADRRGFYGSLSDLKLIGAFKEEAIRLYTDSGMNEAEAQAEFVSHLLRNGYSLQEATEIVEGQFDEVELTADMRKAVVEWLNEAMRRRIRAKSSTAAHISKAFHTRVGEEVEVTEAAGETCGMCKKDNKGHDEHIKQSSMSHPFVKTKSASYGSCTMCGNSAPRLYGPKGVCADCADAHYE